MNTHISTKRIYMSDQILDFLLLYDGIMETNARYYNSGNGSRSLKMIIIALIILLAVINLGWLIYTIRVRCSHSVSHCPRSMPVKIPRIEPHSTENYLPQLTHSNDIYFAPSYLQPPKYEQIQNYQYSSPFIEEINGY